MKKLMLLIAILCSFANADFLEHTNRNLCEVQTDSSNVTIICDIRENDENVAAAAFKILKNSNECAEVIYFKDRAWTNTLWFINKKIGVIGTTIRDEYGVELGSTADKTTVTDIKVTCMDRYSQYKEAAKRW